MHHIVEVVTELDVTLTEQTIERDVDGTWILQELPPLRGDRHPDSSRPRGCLMAAYGSAINHEVLVP